VKKERRGLPPSAGKTALAAPMAVPLLAAALLAMAAAPAAAQLGRKSWEFFPHVGAFFPGDPDFLEEVPGFDGFDPGVLWGIYATYHYTDHVGVELGFSKATANGPENDAVFPIPGEPGPPLGIGDVGFDFWELNGFVNSGALKTLQLFATGGVGLVNYDPEGGGGVTRLLLNGGAGVRYYAWKNIALRGELKDFVFLDARRSDYTTSGGGPTEDSLHNLGFFAGLTFNF